MPAVSVVCPCCGLPVEYDTPPAAAECFGCRQECDRPGQCRNDPPADD